MKTYTIFFIISLLFCFFILQGIYLPKNADLTLEERLFSVERGEGVLQIARNLEKEELIKNRFFFTVYVVMTGKSRSLLAGDYFLSPNMAVNGIARKIISGEVATRIVTIPEGFNVSQIEELLGFTLPGDNLEGFLFPDTYALPIKVTSREVVNIMQENFNKKLTPDLQNEIENQKKTIFEIITMASMIEKEVKTKEDKELVSGILWKRLENGMPLQVDATITYITRKRTGKVSLEDTKIDSPYNTYKYSGLPAGPIANPGLESIMASVYPESSDYWYYLSTTEGETIFSRTLTEHNDAKARYLR